MAAKRWYLVNGVDANGWQALSETAQAAATCNAGWLHGTGSTFSSELQSNAERSLGFAANTVPDGTLDTTLKDAFRTPLLNGAFASANWTFQFTVVGTVQAGAADGQIVFRLIKANADGSGATEITSAQQSSSVITNVTTTDLNGTLTFNPGAITLTNQYLFVQIAWKRTGAGGMTTTNVRLRAGVSASVGTTILSSDYTPATQAVTTAVIASGSVAYGTIFENPDDGSSPLNIGGPSGFNIAQTISGHAGRLSAVSLRFRKAGGGAIGADAVYLELREGTLTGTLLATSGQVPLAAIPVNPSPLGWLKFSFAPVTLSAGTTYWIKVFLTTEDLAFYHLGWTGPTVNRYAGGEVKHTDGTNPYGPNIDLCFQLYLDGHTITPVVSAPPISSHIQVDYYDQSKVASSVSDQYYEEFESSSPGNTFGQSFHASTRFSGIQVMLFSTSADGSLVLEVRLGGPLGTLVATCTRLAADLNRVGTFFYLHRFDFPTVDPGGSSTLYTWTLRRVGASGGASDVLLAAADTMAPAGNPYHLFYDGDVEWWSSEEWTFFTRVLSESVFAPTVAIVVPAAQDVTGATIVSGSVVTAPTVAYRVTGQTIYSTARIPYTETLLFEHDGAAVVGISDPGRNLSQTISGHTGLVTSVSLKLLAQNGPTDAVYIEIRESTFNGTLLATSLVIPATALSTSLAWVNFPLRSAVQLSAGTTYWIESYLTRVIDQTPAQYNLGFTSGNAYAGGEVKNVNGNTFISGWDLAFRLYTGTSHTVAVVAPPDQAVTTALIASGSSATAPVVVPAPVAVTTATIPSGSNANAPVVAVPAGTQAITGAFIGAGVDDLLLEDGGFALLEDGSHALLEGAGAAATLFAPTVALAGAGLSRAVSDSLTVTDAAAKRLVGPVSKSAFDTVSVQDRFTRASVVDRPVRVQEAVTLTLPVIPLRTAFVAETISVSDVRRVGMPLTLRLAEAVALTEFRKAVLPQIVARLSDPVTVIDFRKALLPQIVARPVEAITVTEFRKAVLPQLVARLTEALTVTEFRKAVLPLLTAHPFDSVLVTEFRKALLPQLAAKPFDQITVTEFRKAVLPQLVARLAEVLSPTDFVIALRGLARLNVLAAETVAAAESWKSPLTPYVARLQEVLTLVENIRALLPKITAHPVETSAAIDVLLAQLRTVRLKLLATEVVGVSEHVSAIVSKLLRAVAESLTVVDSAFAEVSTNELRVRLEEIVNITEFAKAVLNLLAVRAAETLSVTDLLKAVLPQLVVQRFETITVAEFLKAVLPLVVRPAETVSASDLLKAVLTPTALRLAETITVAEFVKATFPGFGSASFDSIGVADLLKAVLTPLVARPAENVTVAELWKAVVNPLVQRPVENILVTEFRRAVLPLLATKRIETITVADLAQQLLTLRRIHPAPSSELIAVAEFIALAMSGAGKSVELLTVLDIVRTVLTPGLQKVSDIITIAELAKAVLTPFFSRRADTVTVAELVKTVLTPFAIHAQDVVTVTEALLAFLQFVGIPVVQRTGIETITVAEFVKPLLPSLHVRPAEAVTVGELLRLALQPLIGDLSEVITVTEFRRALLDLGDVDREVYDAVLVSEDVLTALTAIVHFVLIDLRAEDSQSRISGRLSGRVGSGSLRGLPLSGYLRSLAIPKAHRLYGSLRSPALGGFLRRLPVGVATRSTDSSGVSDEARAKLTVGPVTVRE